ncbi:MAG: metal-dependent transcriptional regulator [Ignavibacteriae bacterium]|nr:metal-dependent transcriptional regulator [Ignavibacteriota bacterium]MCB9243098.1 metal-dependent transcriptional regulator [Ignavibacteriales bacterium]
MNISLEDYLKNIYVLRGSDGKVSTTALAEKMHVSPAAISEMVSKLSKSGYIKNTPYKGFELAPKGNSIALNLIRKHRLWEVFLVKYLDYPWDKVHEEAEKLEHSSSDELISKLEKFLGYPEFDPHGHPIPDKNGNIAKLKHIPISEADQGDVVVLTSVSDEDPDVLVYLSKIGIKLGDKLEILEKIDFDNSIQVMHKSERKFLSEKLANCLKIKKYERD